MDVDERVLAIAEGLGLRHIDADCVPADWNWTAERVFGHVISEARDGAIVCLHDGIPPDGGSGTENRLATVAATRLLLRRRDVRYVTVTQLMACV